MWLLHCGQLPQFFFVVQKSEPAILQVHTISSLTKIILRTFAPHPSSVEGFRRALATNLSARLQLPISNLLMPHCAPRAQHSEFSQPRCQRATSGLPPPMHSLSPISDIKYTSRGWHHQEEKRKIFQNISARSERPQVVAPRGLACRLPTTTSPPEASTPGRVRFPAA